MKHFTAISNEMSNSKMFQTVNNKVNTANVILCVCCMFLVLIKYLDFKVK